MAASSSIAFASPFSAAPTALPTGAGSTRRSPSCVRPPWHQHRRLVAVAVKRRRYMGTARREALLAELVERKVAEAMEACAGRPPGGGQEQEEGCRVAWDQVEEVSRARADLRRRIAEAPHDPLEPFCAQNPTHEECAVVYVDD